MCELLCFTIGYFYYVSVQRGGSCGQICWTNLASGGTPSFLNLVIRQKWQCFVYPAKLPIDVQWRGHYASIQQQMSVLQYNVLTRLALQLILDKGFRLFSFQLPDQEWPGIVISSYYLSVLELGNLRACCLPWMWWPSLRPPLRNQTLISRYPLKPW